MSALGIASTAIVVLALVGLLLIARTILARRRSRFDARPGSVRTSLKQAAFHAKGDWARGLTGCPACEAGAIAVTMSNEQSVNGRTACFSAGNLFVRCSACPFAFGYLWASRPSGPGASVVRVRPPTASFAGLTWALVAGDGAALPALVTRDDGVEEIVGGDAAPRAGEPAAFLAAARAVLAAMSGVDLEGMPADQWQPLMLEIANAELAIVAGRVVSVEPVHAARRDSVRRAGAALR